MATKGTSRQDQERHRREHAASNEGGQVEPRLVVVGGGVRDHQRAAQQEGDDPDEAPHGERRLRMVGAQAGCA